MANAVLELAHHRAGLELGLLSPDSELEEHGNNEGRVPHEQLKYSIRVTRLAVPVWARCQTRKAFAFAGRRLTDLVGACGRTVTTIPAAGSPTASTRIATVATTPAKKREGTAGHTWTFCRRIFPIIGFNRSDLQKTKTTWKCVCVCVCK
jgi:hypothetical protein